jgi:hypothetical protein
MISELLNKESFKKEWMLKEYLSSLCVGSYKGDKDTYNALVLASKHSITNYTKKTNLSLNDVRKPYTLCTKEKNGTLTVLYHYETFNEAVHEVDKHPDRYKLIIGNEKEFSKGLVYVPMVKDFIYNHIN